MMVLFCMVSLQSSGGRVRPRGMRVSAMLLLFATGAAADVVWKTDLEAALAEAKRTRKQILINVFDSY